MIIPSDKVSQCPVCSGALEITELHCVRCDVSVGGRFTRSRFDGLSPEQTTFLTAFLRCRGVIRDVEAALGISYPTVRSRLDSLLSALDLDGTSTPPAPPVDIATRRREILRAIDAGKMTAEEGLRELEALGSE
ncbi:MAG: DUF2089 domain-containing protein [Capsulimonadaceae bacterium]